MEAVATSPRDGLQGLSRPEFATDAAYGRSLSDEVFWSPYVKAVMDRHDLPWQAPSAGFVGTFPTMVAGNHVVKLFGARFAGADQHHVERTLLSVLADEPRVPRLVAEGTLYRGGGWSWPYLVMTRMGGTAWRDASLDGADARVVVRELGEMTRNLHRTEPPAVLARRTDLLTTLRPGLLRRHREWGTLPERLITQIPAYLATHDGRADRRLVHADLTEDHVFVEVAGRPRLVGVIDWADAAVTDPYYELVALHLGAFRADKALLSAFLSGYGWPMGEDFVGRAMAATLSHQFDVLRQVVGDVADVASIGELAERLWGGV